MGQSEEVDPRRTLTGRGRPPDPLGLFNEIPETPAYPANEKYQSHLVDQYKLYVEMADRVSARRQQANSYFLSINTAMLAFVGYITSKESSDFLWMVGAAGIALSILWWQIITSYRDLNSAKFKVVHEIEKQLPISAYDAEWRAMGQGKVPRLYRPVSHIERWVPWIFLLLHAYVVWRTFPWTAMVQSVCGGRI